MSFPRRAGGIIQEKWESTNSKIEPQALRIRAQMPPRLGQDGQKMKNNIDPTKKREEPNSVAPFGAKKLPTWPQVGFQDGAKMKKKSMLKSIKLLMHLAIDFWDWEDLGRKMKPCWHQIRSLRRCCV